MEYKDYYQVLGVEKGTDEKEIKKAYRRLARKYHPDVNPGDKSAETRFKEINEAYEVLGDSEKRRKYDDLQQNYQRYQQAGGRPGGFNWDQWSTAGPGGAGSRQGPGGVRVEYGTAEDIFGGAGGFSDFFQSIFGGMGATAPRGARQAPAMSRDIEHEVEITLEEAFRGAQRLLELDGRRLEVKIPPGVKTGSRVRVAGEGMATGRNVTPGDLYLRIKVLPHSTFEQRGQDLYAEVPVDMFTALLGGEVRVPTLVGSVVLRVPPGSQSGRTFRLAGQGMPRLRTPDERGDLYVKIRVRLPEQLSEEEQKLVRQWATLRGVTV